MTAEANYTGDENIQEAAAPPATEHENPQHEQQNEQGDAPQGESVPLSALQSERTHRQELAEELRMIKDHLALMEAKKEQPRQEEKPAFDPDDIPTWGEIDNYIAKRERQYQTSIDEMRMAQKHPDYQEVISKHLPEVISNNPALRKTLTESQDYELAYYLAKNSDSYRSAHKKQVKNQDAERVVQNSQKAGALSSMGTTSPINTAKRYSQMTDEDFRKEVNRNLGYF